MIPTIIYGKGCGIIINEFLNLFSEWYRVWNNFIAMIRVL